MYTTEQNMLLITAKITTHYNLCGQSICKMLQMYAWTTSVIHIHETPIPIAVIEFIMLRKYHTSCFTFLQKRIVEYCKDWLHTRETAPPGVCICHLQWIPLVHTRSSDYLGPVR